MSYEQLESEPAEYADLDSDRLLSSQRYLHQPRRIEAPLSTLSDVKSYVRGSSSDFARANAVVEFIHYEGRGRAETVTAHGNGTSGSVILEGKTDATYDPSFKTAGVKVGEGEGCSCTEGKCIRAKGTLQANYAVDIKVTLPKVSDYPDLDDKQKKRFQKAVTTILSPHEQKHVAAYKKYRGKTSRPFDFTICEGEFDAAVQSMFEAEESPRRQAVQDESDDLDPFFFEFKL